MFGRSRVLGLLVAAAAATATLLATAPAALAADYQRDLDLGQGLNYQRDSHRSFGYIIAVRIGQTDLGPDIRVQDPTALPGSSSTRPVVSVLRSLGWGSGPTDPIRFNGVISAKNKRTVDTLQAAAARRLTVVIDFVAYDFDQVNNAYYPSFRSSKGKLSPGSASQNASSVEGVVQRDGNSLNLQTSGQPSNDVPSGTFYDLSLTASPSSTAQQQLQLATGSTQNRVVPWGLPNQ